MRALLTVALVVFCAASAAALVNVPPTGLSPWGCTTNNFPTRCNANGDIQCASYPGLAGIACWDDPSISCADKVKWLNANLGSTSHRQPVTCGTYLQMLNGTSGYTVKTHWCYKAKYFQGVCNGWELCGDGKDNDGNGLIDQYDPACRENMYVNGCTDGIDNDGDFKADGADNDCLCGNGVVDAAAGEICDTALTTACSSDCKNIPPKALCRDVTIGTDATGLASGYCSLIDAGSSDSTPISFKFTTESGAAACGPLPLGAYTITMVVTDSYPLKLSATCTSTVTVVPTCGNGIVEGTEQCDDGNTVDGDGCSSACQKENHPPVAQCQDVTVYTGAGGLASDYCAKVDAGSYDPDPNQLVSFSFSNCAPVPAGAYTITMTVTDPFQVAASCVSQLTVKPTCGNGVVEIGEVCDAGTGPYTACSPDCKNRAPKAVCSQTMTVPVNAQCQAAVAAAVVDSGSSDPDVGQTISLAPAPATADVFALGTNSYQLTVTDSYAPYPLSDTCTSQVVLVDVTAPIMSGTPDDACLWPPNGKYSCYSPSDFAKTFAITDNCDSAVTLAFTGGCADSTKPSGNAAASDCWIEKTTGKLCVAANKAKGNNSGKLRTFTSTLTASDSAGNTASVPVHVLVPPDEAYVHSAQLTTCTAPTQGKATTDGSTRKLRI